jgi:undecaprenyl-diphosphatase
VAAAIAGGRLLLTWDEPIQRWVESNRTDALDTFFLYATRLGSLEVIVFGAAVLLLIAFRKCPALFLLVFVAAASRPLLEFTMKASVGRDRPNFDRLVGGDGPSFPSGHPLAAIALWGLVPPVIALLTNQRFWWWVATAVSSTAIVIVAASRVYLGVHWFSDAVAALIFGAVFLLVVERLVDVGHVRWPCHRRPCAPVTVDS